MSRYSINYLAMLIVLTLSALAIAGISASPSCVDVTQELTPCLDFLQSNGTADTPSADCCAGAKEIANQVPTNKDKQTACECIKSALLKVGSFDSSRIPKIAQICKVNVYIPPIGSADDYCEKAFNHN